MTSPHTTRYKQRKTKKTRGRRSKPLRSKTRSALSHLGTKSRHQKSRKQKGGGIRLSKEDCSSIFDRKSKKQPYNKHQYSRCKWLRPTQYRDLKHDFEEGRKKRHFDWIGRRFKRSSIKTKKRGPPPVLPPKVFPKTTKMTIEEFRNRPDNLNELLYIKNKAIYRYGIIKAQGEERGYPDQRELDRLENGLKDLEKRIAALKVPQPA